MTTKIKNGSVKKITEVIATSAFLLGILVCIICDLAITKKFSWSLYPIVSIIFTWLVIAPLFHFKKGLAMSLLSFSISLLPFLFFLERITGAEWFLSIGVTCAAIMIGYLWGVYGAFAVKKLRWWYSSAIALLLAIPFGFLVNFALSKAIGEPIVDIWDILSYTIAAAVSCVLFYVGFMRRKAEY